MKVLRKPKKIKLPPKTKIFFTYGEPITLRTLRNFMRGLPITAKIEMEARTNSTVTKLVYNGDKNIVTIGRN